MLGRCMLVLAILHVDDDQASITNMRHVRKQQIAALTAARSQIGEHRPIACEEYGPTLERAEKKAPTIVHPGLCNIGGVRQSGIAKASARSSGRHFSFSLVSASLRLSLTVHSDRLVMQGHEALHPAHERITAHQRVVSDASPKVGGGGNTIGFRAANSC